MNMGGTCPLCRAKSPTSQEEIIKYLRPWVKKKKAWAQNMMGQKYRKGEGVKQSYEMAKKLYELAAQQGNASAMIGLGCLYEHGDGVEQSYERAKEYYEQVADLGNASAQLNLGVMYYQGKGVETDTGKARQLWNKAAAQGDEDAIKYLKISDEENN